MTAQSPLVTHVCVDVDIGGFGTRVEARGSTSRISVLGKWKSDIIEVEADVAACRDKCGGDFGQSPQIVCAHLTVEASVGCGGVAVGDNTSLLQAEGIAVGVGVWIGVVRALAVARAGL